MSFNTIPRSPRFTLQQLISLDKFLFPTSEPLQSPLESRFLEEFDQIESLSKGAFGHVYVAEKKMEKQKYAVKCIKLGKNDEEMAEVTREVKVLSGIKHRNIVFYYNAWWENHPPPEWLDDDREEENDDYSGESDENSFDSNRLEKAIQLYENASDTSRSDDLALFETENDSDTSNDVSCAGVTSQDTEFSVQPSENYTYLFIQMELCQKENLADWLKSRQPAELKVYQIFREILSAVKYLHSKNLAHRDLKPNNIFFDFDWSIKVGDFGLSKKMTTDLGSQSASLAIEQKQSNTLDSRMNHTNYVGTKPYMAPEQENFQTYNHKVDVYALAIILFELKMGPFKTDSERAISIDKLKSFELPHNFERDSNLKQLLFSMLSVDPDKRPEVKDILLDHFPKDVKQLNSRPVKPRHASAPALAPMRHADDVFHSKLLMLFLIRGIRLGYQFQLGAEMSGLGGIFGDLIFKYCANPSTGTNISWRYRFVQAKYKQEEAFKITAIQLLNKNLGDFSLAKYFRSYLHIRRRGYDIHDCLIITNVGFDVNSLIKSDLRLVTVNPSDDILTFGNPSKGKKSACYRLQITPRLRQKLTANWSDIHVLAETLVRYAQTNKPLALHLDVLKRNHVALISERVLDCETKKIHLDFLYDVNLSSGAKQLRQIIFELKINEEDLAKWKFKFGTNFGKGNRNANDFLPQVVKDEDIDGFFDKLVFAVDMPNIAKLDQILTDEIAGQHFTLLGPHLLQTVWELSYQKLLSSEDGQKLIEENKQAMTFIHLNAISIDYRDRLRKFHCQYEPKNLEHLNKELKQFLYRSSETNIHILRLTTTCPKSTAVKVFSALEILRDFRKGATYLIASSKRFEDTDELDRWKKALEAGPYRLLIVVCKDNVQFHEIYSKLILREALKKKVIVICRNRKAILLDNAHSNTQTTAGGWKEIEDHP